MKQLSKDKYSDYFGESFALLGVYNGNIENQLHTELCDRRLNWKRTGELFMLTRAEVDNIIDKLGFERKAYELI